MGYKLVKLNNKFKINWWLLLLILFVIICAIYLINKFSIEKFDDQLPNNIIETKPIETKPTETKPIETKPIETKPIEVKQGTLRRKTKKNNNSMNLGVCSKQCCGTQWPVPINLNKGSKNISKYIGSKYFTSNLSCNNGVTDTGCVCLTRDAKKLLSNRGYVNNIPNGNGLLDEDNRINAFEVKDDNAQKSVDNSNKQSHIRGKAINKYDNKLDKYKTIVAANDISRDFYMPIDSNIVTFNNEISETNISGNDINDNTNITEKILKSPIGINTKDVNITKK